MPPNVLQAVRGPAAAKIVDAVLSLTNPGLFRPGQGRSLHLQLAPLEVYALRRPIDPNTWPITAHHRAKAGHWAYVEWIWEHFAAFQAVFGAQHAISRVWFVAATMGDEEPKNYKVQPMWQQEAGVR